MIYNTCSARKDVNHCTLGMFHDIHLIGLLHSGACMFMHCISSRIMYRAYIICIIICIHNFVLLQISCMLIYCVKIIGITFYCF